MITAIKSGIRQGIGTSRFMLGILFIAAAIFLSSMDSFLEALRSDTQLTFGFHASFILDALKADAYLSSVLCLSLEATLTMLKRAF